MSDIQRFSDDPTDNDLEYVRQKRVKIIDKLMENGVPEDTESVSLLLGALNDMDRTSIGKKRIKVEADSIAVNKQAADLIASIYSSPNSKNIGFEDIDVVAVAIPSVEGKLPTVELLPGEMAVGAAQVDYDGFMKRVGN